LDEIVNMLKKKRSQGTIRITNNNSFVTRLFVISRAGFSIIELLVVISIIAMVTGAGLAILSHSGRAFGFQAIRGEIASLIQYTRGNALIEKGPTYVVIDPNRKEIYSCARRTIGMWHFENTTGAFNNNARLRGDAAIDPAGMFGNTFTSTSTGYAECGTVPILGRDQGISIECWISPTEISPLTERTVFEISSVARVFIEDDDSFRISCGSLSVGTAPSSVPYQRWTYLCMLYEPDYTISGSGTLSLYLNSALACSIKGSANLTAGKWNFTVSNSATPFIGMIDEVKVSIINKTDRLQLEPDVSMLADFGFGFQPFTVPVAVKFDKKGRLSQPVPQIQLISSSALDSFILEMNSWGAVKMR